MVPCILFEVTNVHLNQYKQNKSDSNNNNNDGDNSKNNKNDDGNKIIIIIIIIIIIVVWLFGSKRAAIAGMVDGTSS